MNLVKRQSITEKTLAKYRDKAFSWRKRATCLHLAHYHLRNAGYKLPRVPAINSMKSAKAQLALRGWDNVADMLDAYCERISPASMLLGDFAVVQSDDGLGAIFISNGQKCFGWHQDHDCIVPQEPLEYVGAWRI
jgi:hypothetical protein